MAYDKEAMFDPVGMAALDPKVAAYKKFIKENLGQPTLLQFLQTEQGKRIDPNLAGAMLTLEKLEQARDNAPKAPPPATNVIQDLGLAALKKVQELRGGPPQSAGIAAMAPPQMPPQMPQQPVNMAGGGIVAFADGMSVDGKQKESDEDFVRRVARETEERNQRILGMYGARELGKSAFNTLVADPVKSLGKTFENFHYDPDTGGIWVGKNRPQGRTDQEAWDDYYRQNQGLLSGASPSRQQLEEAMTPEDKAKLQAFRAAQAQRRAGSTPAQIQGAMAGAMDLTKMGGPQAPPMVDSNRPAFAMRPPNFMQAAAEKERDVREEAAARGKDRGGPPADAARLPNIPAPAEARAEISPDEEFKSMMKTRTEAMGPNDAMTIFSNYLTKLETSKGEMKAEGRRDALFKAGMAMAAAASRPGQAGNPFQQFLAAAAQGGTAFAESMPEIRKEIRQLDEKIMDGKFKIANAERQEKMGLVNSITSEVNANMRAREAMARTERLAQIQEQNANTRLMIQERGLTARAKEQSDKLDAQLKHLREDQKQEALLKMLGSYDATVKQLRTDLSNAFDPKTQAVLRAELEEAQLGQFAARAKAAEIAGFGADAFRTPTKDASQWGQLTVR